MVDGCFSMSVISLDNPRHDKLSLSGVKRNSNIKIQGNIRIYRSYLHSGKMFIGIIGQIIDITGSQKYPTHLFISYCLGGSKCEGSQARSKMERSTKGDRLKICS